MAKYFKNVKSFEDLKKQYKKMLKENHPDNGGDEKIAAEINCEYDALFQIWKNKHEIQTGVEIKETAESTRSQFYTEFGWEGSNHSWNRSLKEVAQIVRSYVKEKYPTYKFSVRTSYASMCQELQVDLKESPIEIYKTFEELTEADKNDLMRKMRYNHLFNLNCWNDEELKAEFKRIWNERGNFYKCLNEVTQAVIEDVDSFVKSYNYEDCDGMIDYFHVDFYYFGCAQNNGQNIKIVPKTARIAPQKKEIKTQTEPEKTTTNKKQALETDYTIEQGKHTKTNADIWLVKIVKTLSREEYLKENQKMRSLGGYYSKFTHSFIFDYDPTEKLTA